MSNNIVDSGLIFENFSNYIQDEDNSMETPQGVMRLLREDSSFRDFTDNLIEGIEDPSTRKTISSVLERQRETMLTEAANVSASVFTHK